MRQPDEQMKKDEVKFEIHSNERPVSPSSTGRTGSSKRHTQVVISTFLSHALTTIERERKRGRMSQLIMQFIIWTAGTKRGLGDT